MHTRISTGIKSARRTKKVADAIKADGWTFASHTWGHIRVGDKPIETIQADTEKWLTYVAPLIGGSDIIIFAHGQDLSDWHDYTMDNEKFAYLKSQGFNIYCNVDSSQYFVQVRVQLPAYGTRTWMDTVCTRTSTEAARTEQAICLILPLLLISIGR